MTTLIARVLRLKNPNQLGTTAALVRREDLNALLADWERPRGLIAHGDDRALSFEARAIREEEGR